MRPGPWLLLSLLLSTLAVARNGSGGRSFQIRTLVAPSRPGEVPPLELHASAGLTTLVLFGSPLKSGAVELLEGSGSVQLVRLDDGSLVVALSRDLAPGEQVPFTVAVETGTEPLRFVLVTRRDAVDLRVQVVRTQESTGEDAAESVARGLLDAPDARTTLVLPRGTKERSALGSQAQAQSVLWMGRRLFAIVAMRSQKRGAPPWKLVQARLRATLADGALLEWPARLVSGIARGGRLHVLTSVLPEGASGLEVALDGEDSPGDYQPLPPSEMDGSP
ncbi:DUF2381 family protein [Vitiosangium sp. GDMCC 1.1324]|uniref:DUF2381 family protein n=1 Tax=Vitiosangium sp. (strain GDMCC 1.1324) TaxID=2138576 RepID=UPI000D3A1C96|nr:DUF2381 family protein [Vitiosangium sp. GDMCC 1.1324]PTL81343.1 hypothetical protein DAT35_24850 [Vitiosangium sp. GDMCC 1.1324]